MWILELFPYMSLLCWLFIESAEFCSVFRYDVTTYVDYNMLGLFRYLSALCWVSIENARFCPVMGLYFFGLFPCPFTLRLFFIEKAGFCPTIR